MTLASPVWANMANPWRAGDPVGEPVAELEDLHVLRESLHFDLRGLQEPGDLARVVAEYEIEHRGQTHRELDLYFVAPGLAEGEVRLDGEELSAQPEERPLPEAWGGLEVRGRGDGLRYTASMDPGTHRLRVEYLARPSVDGTVDPVVVHLPYVLAPARHWGSFGGLDVEVKPPRGCTVTSSLPLNGGVGGDQIGTFDGVPSDMLELKIETANPPWLHRVLGPASIVVVVLAAWWAGTRDSPRRHPMADSAPSRGGMVGLLGAALVPVGFIQAAGLGGPWASPAGYAFIPAIVFGAPGGLALGWISYVIGRR